MKRFFLVSLLTFLAVFAFGGGLLIVSWSHHSEAEIPPIQIVE
jgi:spore coat protein CotH